MDYYQILNISQQATNEDIKKAYRKLSKKYHPDMPDGDEDTFKRITEAYEVLIDPQKRKQYDQQFQSDFSYYSNHFYWGNTDYANDFDEYFTHFARSRFNGNKDYRVKLDISLEEGYNGITKTIFNPQGISVNVNIPSGVEHNTIYRYDGLGYIKYFDSNNPYKNYKSSISGDLVVIININNDDIFQLENKDVYTQIEVPWYDLILGGKVEINSFISNETLKFNIPENTKPNIKFRLKNKGYPIQPHSNKRGNFYCLINVKYPELSKNHKEKIKEIKNDVDNKNE